MSGKAFKLSASLEGHAADVRCVTASPEGVVFSASRDGTARSWFPSAASGSRYGAGPTFAGHHDGYINACKWIAGPEGGACPRSRAKEADDASEMLRTGYLVTGGQDKIIAVWPLPKELIESTEAVQEPSHLLVGHEGNVCSLDASDDGSVIVSGSWDKCLLPGSQAQEKG